MAYKRAWDILRREFGRPHQITEAFMQSLFEGSSLGVHNLNGLRNLVRQMVSCELVFNQMGLASELNCSTNLKGIVSRLPRQWQLQWTEFVTDLLEDEFPPTFGHLIRFLERRISVASNCYGQLSGPSGSGANTRIQQIKGFSKMNSTSVDEHTVCRACGSYEHRLDKCHRFQLMTRLQRLDLLGRNGLCFNCFEPHHRSTDCTSESRCTRVGCGNVTILYCMLMTRLLLTRVMSTRYAEQEASVFGLCTCKVSRSE